MHKINTKNIIVIGCDYTHPQGGIAQILYNYDKYVYENFRCIVNSKKGSIISKVFTALFSYLQFFFYLLCDYKIKIVHIHTASYNSFKRSSCFINLAYLFNKKIILHMHGGAFKEYYAQQYKFVNRVFAKCDKIITLSESWSKFYKSILPEQKVAIVNNLIPPPVFNENFKKDSNKKHILYLGLITEQKGIFDLLEVLSKHKAYFEDKLVLHIGGNGKIEKLKKFIDLHNLNNMVIYEGWVSGEKKIELFNLANAFILPSYIEGLPVSILEAMSYGLTILTTPVGGIPEIINENNGVLFTPGAEEEIYHALHEYINNKYETRRMYGKEQAKAYFPEVVTEQLKSIYKEFL